MVASTGRTFNSKKSGLCADAVTAASTIDKTHGVPNSTTSNGQHLKSLGTILAPGAIYQADPTTLVNTPIASACYACHDTKTAAAHMINNGGTLGSPRSTVATSVAGVNTVAIGSAPAVTEQCLVCHGTGAMADIKVVHMNF